MQKTTLILILFISSIFAVAQRDKPIASSCTKGNCYKFTVELREYSNRIYYDITNNTQDKKDIELFIEDKDGKWWSQGYKNNFPAGEETTFDRFNATSNYVIFYKDAGDKTYRFPSESEVQEKFGKKKYGYGNN